MTQSGQGIENKICVICKSIFADFKSHNKQTCSPKCANALLSSHKGRKNMTKSRKEMNLKLEELDHMTNQHRVTIFTGGYEQEINGVIEINYPYDEGITL